MENEVNISFRSKASSTNFAFLHWQVIRSNRDKKRSLSKVLNQTWHTGVEYGPYYKAIANSWFFMLYLVMSRKFRNKLSVPMMILLLTKGILKYFQREISSRPKMSLQGSLRAVIFATVLYLNNQWTQLKL